MQLLERAKQLRTLHALLEEAGRGSGRFVFLGGEAGIGKTALITQFADSVRDRARVLLGACDSLATPRPLGPLDDMVPGLASGDEQGPALFRRFLAELGSGRRPTVAIFEDVHWADQATLDMLRFVGRRVGSSQALLIATYRDDEVGRLHPLRILLGDMATHPAVQRMTLDPLSQEAVTLLAGDSALDPDHLYRKTGGNPFFVTEALLSGVGGIPASVRDAVLARASRLPASARHVLDVAAIGGLRVETWLLEGAAKDAIDSLPECLDSGLLRSDGAAVAFRHELAREAIEAAVDTATAVTVHHTMMGLLRGRPEAEANPARIAYHAEAAGDGETA